MNAESLDLTGLETEESSCCVLCGQCEPVPDMHMRKLLALSGPYDVQRCAKCSLAWLSPRPTAQAYQKIYAYESYFDGSSALEDYAEVAGSRNIHFVKRLERIASLLPGVQRPRLLDIGAATGEFVHEAARQGFAAAGIEISEGARAQARKLYGVELLPGPLGEDMDDGSFDIIHLNHVLEHLADPAAVLSICHRLLAPGGLLVIEVPQQFKNDIDRVKFMLGLKKPEFNIYSLHHIFFFSPDTVTALIRRSGFGIESVATANRYRTPLRPFSVRILLLRVFLGLSDRLHRGGNIIEVYGRKHA